MWLASAIKHDCESIFADTPVPETGYWLRVAPELHARISSVLINSANLKKLVATAESRGSSETKTRYEFRRARSAFLRNLLAGVDLAEILNTKVRNSLEHFDEYLDDASFDLSGSAPPPAPMAAYNMAFSHWEAISPRVHPIRLYIASERKFYNLKYEIDLAKIHSEADAVLDVLTSSVLPGITEPGGLMVPLQRSRNSIRAV